jgi:hypothetical protein
MFRIAAFLGLLFVPLLHAQETGRGDVKVRFLAERAPANLGKVDLLAGKVRSAAFDLPVNHLSEPQTPPARAFSICQAGKEAPLAAVTLPESGKAFIVLLIPAQAGYKPVVVPSDDPSFKPGDVYFYNHSDKPVLGYVGTAKFILQPTTGQTLRPTGAKPENYYDVGFGVREKEGDRALSTTRWPVDPQQRSYVFFFLNPKNNRLDFRAVDEFVPPEKPVP